MVKGLLKKIAVGGLGLATAIIMGSCTRTYIIDGNKVKERNPIFNEIVQYKDGNVIVYSPKRGAFGEDIHIFVNGKRYTSKDTLFYPEYKKEYDYLEGKIDSTKNAEKESESNENVEKDDSWVVRK
jgi:hypothetical protein